jgi:hypothetical protein
VRPSRTKGSVTSLCSGLLSSRCTAQVSTILHRWQSKETGSFPQL